MTQDKLLAALRDPKNAQRTALTEEMGIVNVDIKKLQSRKLLIQRKLNKLYGPRRVRSWQSLNIKRG